MNRIQEENRNYNQEMTEKHLVTTGANAFLSPEELAWLEAHGPIRIGYQDQYLAFCASDGETCKKHIPGALLRIGNVAQQVDPTVPQHFHELLPAALDILFHPV